MSYDLVNRRDNVTKHHADVAGTLKVVDKYLSLKLPPEKINVGFAYYAKFFTTAEDADCDKHPLGCGMVKLEEDDGTDNGKSGTLTFELKTMGEPPKDLKVSEDGSCGATKKTKCPESSCCSSSGYW